MVTEPSLLFYPRPHEHVFHTPVAGVDLACAALEFEGGDDNPLVRALPDVLTVPISEVYSLDRSLELLFGEIDGFRCGHRHVVDRLFEITLIKLLRWLLDNSDRLGLPPGLLSGMADPRIARALAAVHADPGHGWTLTELSRTAQMLRSAFAALFSDVVGSTPHDYLTSWRIMVAQRLLCRDKPISQGGRGTGVHQQFVLPRVHPAGRPVTAPGWPTTPDRRRAGAYQLGSIMCRWCQLRYPPRPRTQ